MEQIKHKKILVVEDEKSLNEAIKAKLEKLGFKVTVTTLAEDAFKMLKEDDFNLIWLDLNLPKMSGMEFLKLVKDDLRLKDKKIVVVSVSGGFDTKDKAKALGAADYFVKSDFPLNDLVNKVAAYA